jgi:hypothetical protein
MTIAVVDNGSVEAASQFNLRAVARALSKAVGRPVAPVSLRHSSRIPAGKLGGVPAATLGPWVRGQVALGERDFVFVPFFVSPQGAIGSALRGELDALARDSGGFSRIFSTSLADGGVLGPIIAARVREAVALLGAGPPGELREGRGGPAIIVVDHGGPAPASAALRDAVASEVRSLLGEAAGPVAAASLESPDGPEFAYNLPLFSTQLKARGFDRGDVIAAPLFLSPGRHAGPTGDLARIASEAMARSPGLRVHFTGLLGDHPLAIEALARGLRSALNSRSATAS